MSLFPLLIVLGRPGNDFDVAATVLFLAGPGGVFYNEQILCPDGGTSTQTFSTSYMLTFCRRYSSTTVCVITQGLRTTLDLSFHDEKQLDLLMQTIYMHLIEHGYQR